MRRSLPGRGMWLVAAFTLAIMLPWLGQAFHVDEPLYLPVARQILVDPAHPLAFQFNWYGVGLPYAEINNTPLPMLYILAGVMKLTGERELPMRLVWFCFPLAAALALFALGGRFLKKPLFPVLIVIASPAFLINMKHLMAEAPAAAFGFWGLYFLVRGVDDSRPFSFWLSAGLFGAATLLKYNAILFILPAVGYSLAGKVPLRRIAALGALSALPLTVYMGLHALLDPVVLRSVWTVTAEGSRGWWSIFSQKSRSFLAFIGGCGVVTALWPYLVFRPPVGGRINIKVFLCVGVAVLFLPVFDVGPGVRGIDRVLGLVLSCGGLLSLAHVFAGPRRRGWALWAPWVLSVSLIQVCLYWSVMARVIVFLIPPLVFGMAEELEARGFESRAFYPVSLACVLMLSLSLASVDYRYAEAQKELAGEVSRESEGRNVWFTGHWGLQYYLERGGARGLDQARGGWEEVSPGDLVVVPRANCNMLRPRRKILSDVRTRGVSHPLPLRLISGWDGQGAFYSSALGFLPFSLGREPVEEFSLIEPL